MPVWSDIEQKHGAMVTERRREEPKWRDLQRLFDEDGENLDPRNKGDDEPEAFDSTPLYAKDEFVSGLFTDGINPADKWFTFGLQDTELAKWGPVAKWLEYFRGEVAASLDPARSLFYLQATPWFGDLAMVGNGFLAQQEIPGEDAISDRAIPFREMYREVDGFGRTSRLHREFMLKGFQTKGVFGDAAPQMGDSDEAKFVHAIYKNPNFLPGALGPRGMPWASCYVSPDKTGFSSGEKGFIENPIHVIEWEQRSGRAWARGPGHKALPDARGNDESARASLVAEQFMAEPMVLVHDENVLTAADIFPGNHIYGGMNENGKQLVNHLSRGENMQYPVAAQEKRRAAIRDALYFSLFQLLNRPQMTATEFSGWSQEKLRRLARHLVCLHVGLGTFIARRAGILQRQNRIIQPPPPELAQAGPVKLKFNSPFDQAQKLAKANGALRVGSAVVQLTEAFPDIRDNYNSDNIARVINDGFTGDPDLVNDPRDVAAMRQQRQAQQEKLAQLEMAQKASGIYADVAHADQATTLAGQRAA